MPRNSGGTYSLPSGNPVVSGNIIEASWANSTLSDLATEMTNSLSRTGAGGMTGPLRLANGSASVPSLAWGSETGTGFYRAGTSDTRFVTQTALIQQWTATGTAVTGTFSVTGNTTLGDAAGDTLTITGTAVTTPNGLNIDSDTLVVDAANNLVGIGTSSPATKLDVRGASGVSAQIYETSTGNNNRLIISQVAGLSTYNTTFTSASTNAHVWQVGGSEYMRLDSFGNLITNVNGTAPSLSTNSTMSFELTSNTSLKIVVRGTDGVTRSATLTLS